MVGCAWSRMLCLVVRSFLHVSHITMRFLCVDCECRGTCLKHQWKLWLRNNRGFYSRDLRMVGGLATTIGRRRVVSWRNKSQTGQQTNLLFDKLLPVAITVGMTNATLCAESVPGARVVGSFPVPRNEPSALWPMVSRAYSAA